MTDHEIINELIRHGFDPNQVFAGPPELDPRDFPELAEYCVDDFFWQIRDKKTGCCPITFLCLKKTGKSYAVRDFEKAAKEIGLPLKTARRWMKAADGLGKEGGNIQHLRRLIFFSISGEEV